MLRPRELRDFAGLRFVGHDDGVRSDASEGFWALWRHDRDEMRRLGFRVTKLKVDWQTEKWVVYIDIGKLPMDLVMSGVEDLQLALFAAQRKSADSEAETARRNREVQREQDLDRENRIDIAHSKLISRYGNLADPELIASAQASGRECWQQWRSFCVSKKRFVEFSAIDARISLAQAAWLLDLVDQTEAKATHVRDNLTASGTEVDVPDDEVVAAVESLCWSDSDQATEENGAGWSKAHSSKGHWCHGMIKSGGANRDIGIDAARNIVGKYTKQLARGEAA